MNLYACRLFFGLGLVLAVSCFTAGAGLTNGVIEVPALATGYYDVHGEHDNRIDSARTGEAEFQDARSPLRGFFAFHIPEYQGTVTRAVLVSYYYYKSGEGFETLELREVTTPVSTLRRGGFGLTNIYADLGDGPLYATDTIVSNAYYAQGREVTLNSNALAVLQSRRGQDFAMGSRLVTAHGGAIDYAQFGSSHVRLRLDILGPEAPVIHTPPAPQWLASNDVIATVGACGAEPMAYYWFINGTNLGPSDYPQLHFYLLNASSVSTFVMVSNAFGTATSGVTQLQRVPANLQVPATNLVVRVEDYVQVVPQIDLYDAPAQFTWRKDRVIFDNPDNYFLSFPRAQTNDTGDYTVVVSNLIGVVTSAVVRLEVRETPPVFWSWPINQNVPLGGYVYSYTTVVGGPAPHLQWFHGGVLVPGQTNASLYFEATSLSESGDYELVASNHLGVARAGALVTLYRDPPVFSSQPQSQLTYPGHHVALSAEASGQPIPEYQWSFNGTPLPGAIYAQLNLYGATAANSGDYFCVASNASGATTSEVATITVASVPPVLSGPADVIAFEGFSTSFSLTVSNPPASVQWQFNGVNIPGTWFDLPNLGGFFTHYFSLEITDTNKAGLYSAIVSNAFGYSTSRLASLTVTSAAPVFVSQPSHQSVLEGANVDLNCYATGAPSPQFYLYRDGVYVAFSPNGSFRLRDVNRGDSGDYNIVASNRLAAVISQSFHLEVQRAGPLDRWLQRSPLPQGNDLFSVTYGQNKFVAVGQNGAIINSTDGTNWNVRSLRTTDEFLDVTYGDGYFVAVGDHATILTSTNGDDWSRQQMAATDRFWAVTYAAGRFIAVGQHVAYTAVPSVFVSSNAVDWIDSSFDAPTASYLRGVAYGAGALVVVDAYAESFRSTDFSRWALTATDFYWSQVVRFLNGQFIVAGDNGLIVTSPDGLVWTKQTSGVTKSLTDAAYGNGQFVTVGARGNIRRSSDGVSWAGANSTTADRLEGVCFGNGLFVAVGENGTILTSNDGQSWMRQLRGSNSDLDGLATDHGLAVAVGKDGAILTSSNGRDWDMQTAPGPQDDWHDVAYGNGQWVIVGESTNVLISADAITWEPHPVASTNIYLKSVLYANGVWVAVGVQGLIVTSYDGLTWTQRSTGISDDLNELAYGNGKFVVVGDQYPNPNGTILTSTNGLDWTQRNYLTGKNTRGIGFAGHHFLVAMNDGHIMLGTNPDLYDWQSGSTPVEQEGKNLRGVLGTNDLWLLVGNNGIILSCVSTNPLDFKQRVTPTDKNLHAVRFIAGTYVAVGNNGTILQSGPVAPALTAERAGTNLRLVFSSANEGIYQLQETTNFLWQDLARLTNSPGAVEYMVPVPPGGGHRFYRVISP